MLNRFINILLIFVLLVSAVGVSTCKAYCASQKTETHSCCSKGPAKKSCCTLSDDAKSNSDYTVVKASVYVPNMLLLLVATLPYFDFSTSVLDVKHSGDWYNPPIYDRDISVLHQVFRI